MNKTLINTGWGYMCRVMGEQSTQFLTDPDAIYDILYNPDRKMMGMELLNNHVPHPTILIELICDPV